MSIPSVLRIARAMFVIACLITPFASHAQLQGRWECSTRSGSSDPNTDYTLRCKGFLNFKTDRVLESTCSDGFFPSGAYWQLNGRKLTLMDSGGKAFADFEVRELGQEVLVLERSGVSYRFKRAG